MDTGIWAASFLLLSLLLAWSVALSSGFCSWRSLSLPGASVFPVHPRLSHLQVAYAEAVSSGL